jgi:hypothetical protein
MALSGRLSDKMILRITVGLHTVLLLVGLRVVMILMVKFRFDLRVWS